MPKTDDYLNALNIAREDLISKDPGDVCRNAGAIWDSSPAEKSIALPYLNRKLEIKWPELSICSPDGGEPPSLQEQILVLHYLLHASDKPVSGSLITFREIPSGEFYYEPFCKRAQKPMLAAFGAEPERLWTAGEKLGGSKANIGDVSMTFAVFPKVSLTLVLWRGDHEFPPEGNILFDASIARFFNAENVAFLAGTVIYRLISLARA